MKIKVRLGNILAIVCVAIIVLVVYFLKSPNNQITKFRVRDFQFYNCRDKRRIGGMNGFVNVAANTMSRIDG
jgi:hypothetical protein